jgi:hypothetical protein
MIYDIHGSTLAFESLQQASPPYRLSAAPPPHTCLLLLVMFAHFLWVAVSVHDFVK